MIKLIKQVFWQRQQAAYWEEYQAVSELHLTFAAADEAGYQPFLNVNDNRIIREMKKIKNDIGLINLE
jgi:hypothetical protein